MEKQGPGPVPPYLRDKSANFFGAVRESYQQTMNEASGDHGAYQYPHDFPGGWVNQQYLPLGMPAPGWYQAKSNGYEAESAARLAALKGQSLDPAED